VQKLRQGSQLQPVPARACASPPPCYCMCYVLPAAIGHITPPLVTCMWCCVCPCTHLPLGARRALGPLGCGLYFFARWFLIFGLGPAFCALHFALGYDIWYIIWLDALWCIASQPLSFQGSV
jgi:hypothetical protein